MHRTRGFGPIDALYVTDGSTLGVYGGPHFALRLRKTTNWAMQADPGTSIRILSDGRILEQHGGGTISLLTIAAHSVAVRDLVKHAGPWWYDTKNGYLYFAAPSKSRSGSEPMWRMAVPR